MGTTVDWKLDVKINKICICRNCGHDPDVWDVIPDIEYTIDSYGGSLIFYYCVCDISTKYPWCITPDHEVIE